MTAPNGPTGPQPQPPYNPRPPGSGSSVPRSVLIGGAAAVVAIVVVVVLVITLSGGGGDDTDDAADATGAESSVSTSSEASEFVPNLGRAVFTKSGWYDKTTDERVTPPQHITITDSLDLTKDVEAIGYGPVEQSMPKIAKYASTESSFPRNPPIGIFVDDKGDLRLAWACETMYNEPAGANCHSYNMTLDISGASPVVVGAEPTAIGPFDASSTAVREEARNMSVSNPEELPASTLGTDKGTGATTVLVLGSVQPRESTAKVYFLVPDSLKLYVGELESSR